MRLSKALEILNQNIELLELSSDNRGAIVHVGRVDFALQAARNISAIDALRNDAFAFIGVLPILASDEVAHVSPSVWNSMNSRRAALSKAAKTLREVLLSSVAAPSVGTIYFRLPDTSDLADLAADIKEIDQCFNLLFSGNPDMPRIKLEGVDSGSMWLILTVATKLGLGIFLNVINGALGIAERVQRFRKEEIEIRKLNASASVIEAQAKTRIAVTELLCRAIAVDLEKAKANESNSPSLADDVDRYTNAIERLATLFQKGASIEIPQITHKAFSAESDITKKAAAQLAAESAQILHLEQQGKSEQDQ